MDMQPEPYIENRPFSHLDLHFAQLIREMDGRQNDNLLLAAAAVSQAGRQGHVCLDLTKIAGVPIFPEENRRYPELEKWIEDLNTSEVVGTPGDFKPLILDGTTKRLYLHRFAMYQQIVVQAVCSRLSETKPPANIPGLQEILSRLFGVPEKDAPWPDWQKTGCILSLVNRFSVISGGPGTGKTTTIVKLLALHLEASLDTPLKIALTVPTGKAAARLQDAIREARRQLSCSESVQEKIPAQATTIHRLLGPIMGSSRFRHNPDNLLDLDLVVVDESSMVDLALLAKLVQALPEHARLILVGDKDQLASVETGAVFGDICDTCRANTFSPEVIRFLEQTTGSTFPRHPKEGSIESLPDCLVQLQTNYRFGDDSGIRKVSEAIQNGRADLVFDLLQQQGFRDIAWLTCPRPEQLPDWIEDTVVKGFQDCLEADNAEQAIRTLARFKILCALREGPYGVRGINWLVEDILMRKQMIPDVAAKWYHGRPVMITRNDYELNLYNGDIGLTWKDPQDGTLQVCFPDNTGGIRKIHPVRIKDHETVFAMTVHKSQGSEFDAILLLLPNQENPVLTRELIYTGITRARRKVQIWGGEEVFRQALERRVKRFSGLQEALLEGFQTRGK